MTTPIPAIYKSVQIQSWKWLTGPLFITALLAACSPGRQPRTHAAKGEKLRLEVGDVKEVRLASPKDTNTRLFGTSENQEVVDVSLKQLTPTDVNALNLKPSESVPAVFQIKGITAGTARVVLSEKQPGTDGAQKIRKTYTVEVVAK